MVVGGVPVGEVPPDRGQVPDERVGDHPAGIREDREPPPDQVGGLELRLADEGADDERAVPLGDRPEPGDPVEVDHVARGREPELHQGDEALTAREDLRVAAEPAEQRDGVLEGGRAVILEGRRNHARPPSAGNRWTGGEADCRPILGATPGPVKGRLGDGRRRSAPGHLASRWVHRRRKAAGGPIGRSVGVPSGPSRGVSDDGQLGRRPAREELAPRRRHDDVLLVHHEPARHAGRGRAG